MREFEPDTGKLPVPEQFINGGFEAGHDVDQLR